MWTLIKILFSSLFSKTEKRTYIDARLGKMMCEVDAKGEQFFLWNAEIKSINKTEPTTISVEGDINGPNPELLQKAYTVIGEIEDFKFIVQKELDYKFAEKRINLSKEYYIDDISLYLEDELDFEIEFYSDEQDQPMISVAFNNKNIAELDFY